MVLNFAPLPLSPSPTRIFRGVRKGRKRKKPLKVFFRLWWWREEEEGETILTGVRREKGGHLFPGFGEKTKKEQTRFNTQYFINSGTLLTRFFNPIFFVNSMWGKPYFAGVRDVNWSGSSWLMAGSQPRCQWASAEFLAQTPGESCLHTPNENFAYENLRILRVFSKFDGDFNLPKKRSNYESSVFLRIYRGEKNPFFVFGYFLAKILVTE